MPGCEVVISDRYNDFIRRWTKSGYSTAEKDSNNALSEIVKDIKACNQRMVPGFSTLLEGRLLFKYRYKNSGAREGARGGWRIIAIYDPQTGVLTPIVIYPKKEWLDVPDETITDLLKHIKEAHKA